MLPFYKLGTWLRVDLTYRHAAAHGNRLTLCGRADFTEQQGETWWGWLQTASSIYLSGPEKIALISVCFYVRKSEKYLEWLTNISEVTHLASRREVFPTHVFGSRLCALYILLYRLMQKVNFLIGGGQFFQELLRYF